MRLEFPITSQHESTAGSEDYEPPESVLYNLARLEGDEFGRMFVDESFGGTGDMWEIDGQWYPCAGVNGYANRETGRISAFGNYDQDIDPAIVARDALFTLRVVLRMDLFRVYILGMDTKTDMSDLARATILETAALYNQERR